jgi:hypothetical protein
MRIPVQETKRDGVVNARQDAIVLHDHFAVFVNFHLRIAFNSQRSKQAKHQGDHLHDVAVQFHARGNPLLQKVIAAVVRDDSPENIIKQRRIE